MALTQPAIKSFIRPLPTIVIAAPGPSLSAADLQAAGKVAPILAIGDAFRLAPEGCAVYHADYDWWAAAPTGKAMPNHVSAGLHSSRAFTRSQRAAEQFGLEYVECRSIPGFGIDRLHSGGNSGYQAINLALLMGAQRIILTGYDYQATGGKKHFFGDHPGRLNRPHAYDTWLAYLRDACQRCSIPIINASRETAIDFLPRMTMDQALFLCSQ